MAVPYTFLATSQLVKVHSPHPKFDKSTFKNQSYNLLMNKEKSDDFLKSMKNAIHWK